MNRDPRSVYRQGLGESANPVRLITLLYEQLIEDLRRAAAAIDGGKIEARTHELSHGLAVLGELESSLNMEAGQEIAENLSRFYGILRTALLRVQFHPDRRALDKHIASLLSLREAWAEVERRSFSPPAVTKSSPSQLTSEEGNSSSLQVDWRG